MNHSLNDRISFYRKISFLNFYTCCSIILNSRKIITNDSVINGELLMTIYKWYEELKYGYTLKSYDITSHHLGLFLVSTIVKLYMPHRKDELIKGFYIHIPFLFRSIKYSTQNQLIKKYAENIYLISWFPFSGYRLLTLFNSSRDSYNNDGQFNFLFLSFMFITFTMLDLNWTPWNKYRQILTMKHY